MTKLNKLFLNTHRDIHRELKNLVPETIGRIQPIWGMYVFKTLLFGDAALLFGL